MLAGRSGAGKTQLALSQFQQPVICQHLEDLRLVTTTTDGIVFDDVSFFDHEPEQIIQLLSVEIPRTIKGRYENIRLEPGTPLLFTTNVYARLFPVAYDDEQKIAIQRRHRVIHVTENLF